MPLKIESRHLKGVAVLVPEVFQDDRGYFLEAFRADHFGELCLPTTFLQEKPSLFKKSLRGYPASTHPAEVTARVSVECHEFRENLA